MKTLADTFPLLVARLAVLLTMLPSPVVKAEPVVYPGNPTEIKTIPVPDQVPDDTIGYIRDITLKFYDENFELVFSVTVCAQDYDCDERLNQLINQSDFITEVDQIRIYILKH